MKRVIPRAAFAALALAASFALASCSASGGGDDVVVVPVAFSGVSQAGGVPHTTDTASLVLVFDADPVTLAAEDVTVIGATAGTLSGAGLARTLEISGISVADGETVTVRVGSPAGYAVSGSPRSVAVCRKIAVGRSYPGGMIAYVLQPGDAGYDEFVPHGLVLSNEDLHTYCKWAVYPFQETAVGGTSKAIGTGRANTDLIVAQNGAGEYAAYLARTYAGGGLADWYLPSADEMLAIRRNVDLYPSCYRTSSEANASEAYVVWNDFAVLAEGKYGGRYVRAVRSF